MKDGQPVAIAAVVVTAVLLVALAPTSAMLFGDAAAVALIGLPATLVAIEVALRSP